MLALPLIGSVGVAVDFTSVNATRTAFQSALDATALTMAKTAATQNSGDLQTNAKNHFNPIITKSGVSNIVVTRACSAAGGSKLVLIAVPALTVRRAQTTVELRDASV